ncbi:MAG: ABC transporter ATP-binding protein, partial [Proteobacteria bacterium]|nr:ABC transporter ATP-binding protein [Pseudomonadota bacterium]
SISIGDLTAFVAYAGTVSVNLGGFFDTIINVQPALVSFSRVIEMFRVIPEYDKDGLDKHYLVPAHCKGEILFDNVTFSYKPQEPVLKNISCTIHPGDIIALTGLTGAGKTTFINLILKFNLPQNGTIYLDGNKLSDIDPRWLRSQIGIVSQDIFLFNDTIEHNIKYGNPHAPFEEVVHVAQQAHIHHEIERFENGYNTIVGERGIKLSVGQRQRISLARAFLKKAPLLIFDEPTSALDPETENLLKDSLWQLTRGRTTFIITHHQSRVDIATRIFHLSEGGILERPFRNV